MTKRDTSFALLPQNDMVRRHYEDNDALSPKNLKLKNLVSSDDKHYVILCRKSNTLIKPRYAFNNVSPDRQ